MLSPAKRESGTNEKNLLKMDIFDVFDVNRCWTMHCVFVKAGASLDHATTVSNARPSELKTFIST